jgi:hypothetical protein
MNTFLLLILHNYYRCLANNNLEYLQQSQGIGTGMMTIFGKNKFDKLAVGYPMETSQIVECVLLHVCTAVICHTSFLLSEEMCYFL